MLAEERRRRDLTTAILEGLRPPPDLTVSEWADADRYLSAESSAEPGRWRTDRAPYLRGIMDAFSDPEVAEIWIQKSAQTGGTEVLNNIVGYCIAHVPCPILVLQPTVETGQAWSKDRLAPMLRDTPALRGRVKDARTRDSGNTVLHKTFPGGHITIAGANSPVNLAMRPIKVVLADEVDRYPVSAGTEGDPLRLAWKRTTTFWDRKLVVVSTPTVKGLSRIELGMETTDKRRLYVPCHACGEFQWMRWAQVRWPKKKPEAAVYVCEGCGAEWSDVQRWEAMQAGEWVAGGEFQGRAGFYLSEMVSPWVPLGQMAANFVEAKNSRETLRVWINTSLGESWEEDGSTADPDDLWLRREEYGPEVPDGAVVLTAGVDIQEDRIEVEVVGWGVGEESWSVAYRILSGNTARQAVWDDLDEYLSRRWEHDAGVTLPVAAACVDTGYRTAEAYAFCKGKHGRRVLAVKGVGTAGHPVLGRASKRNKARVPVYPVGDDAAKGTIVSRLLIEEPGPGYCHFPKTRDEEYFSQLTAEKAVTRYKEGFPYRVWVKTRPRNEALDCRKYAFAALVSLNCDLRRLAEALRERSERFKPPPDQVPAAEVVDGAEARAEVETTAARRELRRKSRGRRRGGRWATGWRR